MIDELSEASLSLSSLEGSQLGRIEESIVVSIELREDPSSLRAARNGVAWEETIEVSSAVRQNNEQKKRATFHLVFVEIVLSRGPLL